MNYPFRRTSFTLCNGNYELKWPLCTNIVRCASSIIHVFMQGIGRLLMRTVFPPQRAYEPYGLVHCSTSITNASFAHAEIRSHSPSSLLCATSTNSQAVIFGCSTCCWHVQLNLRKQKLTADVYVYLQNQQARIKHSILTESHEYIKLPAYQFDRHLFLWRQASNRKIKLLLWTQHNYIGRFFSHAHLMLDARRVSLHYVPAASTHNHSKLIAI